MGHLEKAVVFEGRKVHVRCDIDQIKQQGPQLSTIGKERLTLVNVCHTCHVPLADVGVERLRIIKGCCVWEKEEEK